MGSYQNVFDNAFSDRIYELATNLIESKLLSQGFHLSARQRKALHAALKSNKIDDFEIRSARFHKSEDIFLEITEEDLDKLEKEAERILSSISGETIMSIGDEAASQIFDSLNQSWPKERRRQKRNDRYFYKEHRGIWNQAIELLSMLRILSVEMTESHMLDIHEAKHEESPITMGVVTRLHARACQTMGEIIVLLKAGYADGAMARWRTLHETAVILNFIVENGESVAIRYANHKAIHVYKSAKEYRRYYERLGYEPITEEEFSAARTNYEKQIEKYGASFKSDYGWAAEALNMPRPTFRDMEEAVKLDHFHAYYGFACHSVHCDSKGTFSRMGVSPDNSPILVGPSVFGLIDPISCSSISLVQTTMPLLCFESTLDSYISCRILVFILDKISQTLCTIDDINESASN